MILDLHFGILENNLLFNQSLLDMQGNDTLRFIYFILFYFIIYYCRAVNTATFSTVGTFIVSSSKDRTIRVWDLKYMKSPITIIRLPSGANK